MGSIPVQFTITQGSVIEPTKFISVTDTGTISTLTGRKNPDGSFDRPAFAEFVVDRSPAEAHYFGVAMIPTTTASTRRTSDTPCVGIGITTSI